LNAGELNQFCGTCHRKPLTPDDPTEDRIPVSAKFDWSNPWNVRHQPAYLSQSSCFRASGGMLSCITCHDPHAAAKLPLAAYDNRCAACHRNVKHQAMVSGACVQCHMPAVAATAEMAFADHWIGVYRGGGATAPAAHNWPPLALPSTPEGKTVPPNDPSTLRPLFDEALARSKAGHGVRSAEAARNAWLLGSFLEEVGAAEAQQSLLEALTIDRANGSPEVAADAMELARALQSARKVTEAIARFDEAARSGNARVSALSYASLAKLDPANAEAHYAKAITAEETASGKDSPKVAALLSNLALAVFARGDSASAEAMLRRALQIQNLAFGTGHLQSAVSMNNLATVLQRMGKLEEAEAFERDAVSIFERKLPISSELAAGYANLASLLAGSNDVEAERLLRRAIAIDEAAGGAGSTGEAEDLASLARLLHAKDPVAAVALFRQALSIFDTRLGSVSRQAAEIRKALAGMEAGTRSK
jgi:tetratricopeptide (TPR) repeat protein